MKPTMVFLIVLIVVLAACAPQPAAPTATPAEAAAPPTTAPVDTAPPTDAAAVAASPTPEVETAPGAGSAAAWQTIALTNARTGESFTLADFAGQTILVEPMATWCSNCRSQLGRVTDAYNQLAGQDVVFVALSVGENISDTDLLRYAEQNSFPFMFAVANTDLVNAMVEQFGRAVISPPSTPHFIIRPDGSFTDLFTGSKSADELVQLMTGGA